MQTDNDVFVRQNILDFVQDEQQLALFLLGLRAVQHKTITDPMSYWQLAGIHGMPYTTYDDIPPAKNGSGGYCNHGNPLFPTWHRPYMKVFENSIRDEALKIVEGWSWLSFAPDIALSWKQAASRLRLPYWDWASHQTEIFGIPDIFLQDTVTIKIPTGNSIPSVDLANFIVTTGVQPLPPDTVQEMVIANPLKAYTLPKPLGKIQASSDIFNPTQRPYTPPLNGDTPFTPKGYSTVRHPDSNYRTQTDKLNLSTQRYSAVTLRPSVWMSFQEKLWKYYSNHYSSPDESKEYAHFASLEVVHDALHDAVGGEGGHMSYPDVAAFDPIFWLHHCNTDRLLALWQRCWTGPESWVDQAAGFSVVEANFSLAASTPITADTPLAPFKRSRVFQNDKLEGMCTSNDVRDVRKLGYTYPELEKFNTLTSKEFLTEMLNMYKPVDYIKVIYLAEFDKIPKKKLGGPYSIRVFIDKKDATAKTPLSDPHYAGSVSVFARDAETQCANCEDKLFIRGQVDLTRCMRNLGLTLTPEDPVSYIAKLKSNITLVLVNQAGQQIDSRIAGLVDGFRPTDQDTFKVVYLQLVDGRVAEQHKKLF